MKEIYLDNASSTKIDDKILKIYTAALKNSFANPSSIHQKGEEANEELQQARKRVAKVLGCSQEEIIFTSGGTESNNIAIKGFAFANKDKGNHIITTKIEHSSVLETCRFLQNQGFNVTYVNVDSFGMVNLEDLKSAITKETILISIIYANNEIGTIQNIKEIAKVAKSRNIALHTDACQASSLNLNVQSLGVSLMTLNSSKLNSPKGTGLLYIKKGIKMNKLMHGGSQEFSLRGGTQNLPSIIAFSFGLELVQKEKDNLNKKQAELRDYFISEVSKRFNATLNGHPFQRLSNNINISIPKVDSESLLIYLSSKGIYCSKGSACESRSENSHVLESLNLEKPKIKSSLRFTLSKDNTISDMKKVLSEISTFLNRKR